MERKKKLIQIDKNSSLHEFLIGGNLKISLHEERMQKLDAQMN
jgi:hypothetical protein